MKGKGSKSPGSQLYDRLLVPRIENYALNNDCESWWRACWQGCLSLRGCWQSVGSGSPQRSSQGIRPGCKRGAGLTWLSFTAAAGRANRCPTTLRCPNPNPTADTDVDAVTDHLRRNYKEYQRQKAGPFKNQVARAIEVITRRGGVAKPEIKLQVGCVADRRQGRVSCVGAESPAMGSPAPRLRCAHVLCSL